MHSLTVSHSQMESSLASKTEVVSIYTQNNLQWYLFLLFLGLIITPSFICLNPHEIKNEPYDVLLKSQASNYSNSQ